MAHPTPFGGQDTLTYPRKIWHGVAYQYAEPKQRVDTMKKLAIITILIIAIAHW